MNLKDIRPLRKIVYLWRHFRDKHSYMQGTDNRVHNSGVRMKTRIQITGTGNKVILEKGSLLKNSLIKIQGNQNIVIIHKDAFVSGAELWIEDNEGRIEIGERTFVGHHSHLACTDIYPPSFVGRYHILER